MRVVNTRLRDRPKGTWMEIVEAAVRYLKIKREDVLAGK